MRKLFILLLVMNAFVANAQRVYFIYLQTESGEPFFVRMNEKLYSSTASGYLIISKLRDSVYNFRLGFPGKDLDLNFSSSINGKDHGYLVKNFGDKGWGLFDMQGLGVQMATGTRTSFIQTNPGDIQVNAFTELLSKASDDPSLKQAPAIAKEEKKVEPIQVVNKEKLGDANENNNKQDEKKSDVVLTDKSKETELKKDETKELKRDEPKIEPGKKLTAAPWARSTVSKISTVNVNEGKQFTFIDSYADNRSDTIVVIINEMPPQETKSEEKNADKKFLDITNEPIKTGNKEEKQPEEKKEEVKIDKPLTAVKNNCKAVAVDEDFLKLRRKMAARTNDDGMLEEARKYFRTKCFTTEQVRNLSTLFLSNPGKYHFFDAAYSYVSDPENFSSLQNELKDEYYQNRFKAMLRD
jgi:hypothetical protein